MSEIFKLIGAFIFVLVALVTWIIIIPIGALFGISWCKVAIKEALTFD
jgi:hypothetical protein